VKTTPKVRLYLVPSTTPLHGQKCEAGGESTRVFDHPFIEGDETPDELFKKCVWLADVVIECRRLGLDLTTALAAMAAVHAEEDEQR